MSNPPNTMEAMIRFLGDDYLGILHIHSQNVASWSEELLGCISHLLSLMIYGCCDQEQTKTKMKILFTNEMIACNHVEDLMRITAHEPFYSRVENRPINDETFLIDSTLLGLILIFKTQTVDRFLLSKLCLQDVLLKTVKLTSNERISLHAYAILGNLLTNEQLKELSVADCMVNFFFRILEEGYQHPSKKYERIPIVHVLKGIMIQLLERLQHYLFVYSRL